MKEKIILFALGILLGTIITTGSIFVYTKFNTSKCDNVSTQVTTQTPPEMPNDNFKGNRHNRNNTEENNNQNNNNTQEENK